MISPSTIVSALLLAAAASQVRAANDWSKPCLQGDCSYDVTASSTSVPASMRVWGSTNAISDVTEAAGWMIMGCDSNESEQSVRLVCKSTDEDAAGCSHVMQNGAKDTLVRLPQDCGKAAFAVVTAWDTAKNQSIPADVMKKIDTKGKRAAPQVRAATLSTDWSKANAKTHGGVSFAVVGTSSDPSLITVPKSKTRRALAPSRRSLFGSISSAFGSVTSALGSAGDAVTSEAGKVAGEATSVAGAAAAAVTAAAGDANNVNVNKSTTFPINASKTVNLANANVACGDLGNIKLNADVDLDTKAQVALGVVAGGTLVPPALTTFSLSGGLTGDVGGTLKLSADATGAPFDTGKIQIFTIGIPGLDIPDVLQVGPTFSIDAQANLALSAAVDVNVGLNYHIANAAFVFPPQASIKPTGMPSPKDNMLDISVSPNVTATGSLTAHLIPSLNFGVSAFAGKASATIFLDTDVSSTLELSLGAGAKIVQAVPARRASVSAGVQGCVDAKAGVSVNAGAQGSLFGLFDDSKTIPIFSKNFELFSQCVGTNTKRAEEVQAPSLGRRTVQLQCPKLKGAAAKPLVSKALKAAEIKAL